MSDELRHLAWLARIELKDDEMTQYKEHIERMIDYLNMLDEVNIDLESYHLTSNLDVFRGDIVRESKDDIFSIVINKKDRFVKAPKMI